MEQEIKKFMENHQMIGNSDACNYHMALGFYYAYSADAYRLAEMLENGELFDEMEVSIVIMNLYVAENTLRYFQKKLGLPAGRFRTSETICFKKGKLELGKLTGDVEDILATAKQWLPERRKKSDEELNFMALDWNWITSCIVAKLLIDDFKLKLEKIVKGKGEEELR